jgi:hypothetical protein
MAKKRKGVSIETNDQNLGGSFNAHKHWKKLRAKHQRHKKLGLSGPTTPEVYKSAGKGDVCRESDVSKELYDLNYDLAFGTITREEYELKLKELSSE